MLFIPHLEQQLAMISISGIDSKVFLQGQITNDINLLESQNWIFALHLNNKGRALGAFIVIKIMENHYYLITTVEILEKIMSRLKMFILRSKVNINQIDNKYLCLCSLTHPQYKYLTSVTTLPLINLTETDTIFIIEEQDHANLHVYSNKLETVENDEQRRVLEVDLGRYHEPMFSNRLSMDPQIDYMAQWKQFLITNKIPFIYSNTEAIFIPQQINYDILGGVSFIKGCYTGQEIVARTHYLGKIKRRMYPFTSECPTIIGQLVISQKMNNQAVGVIVECITNLDNSSQGLLSIQIDCIDSACVQPSSTATISPLKIYKS